MMMLSPKKRAAQLSLPTVLFVWCIALLFSLFGEGILEKGESSLAALSEAVVIRALFAIFIPLGVYLFRRSLKRWEKGGGTVLALALAFELPYDLILGGRITDMGRQSPLFALCICCVAAYLFSSFYTKPFVVVLVGVFSILWAVILRVDSGVPIVLAYLVIALTEKREAARPIALAAVLAVCTLISPYYALSPIGALLLCAHNGE